MISRVNPLYIDYAEIDSARGMNNLYVDTQVVNYMRKGTMSNAVSLRELLTKNPTVYELYFSAAHLSDYLRDDTEHKNYDLEFMAEIGMINFIAYDEYKRICEKKFARPIDVFYRGRLNSEQAYKTYKDNRKPRLDQGALNMYDWFRETLVNFENNESSLNELDRRNVEVFLELRKQIDLNSSDLNKENFISKLDSYWKEILNSRLQCISPFLPLCLLQPLL